MVLGAFLGSVCGFLFSLFSFWFRWFGGLMRWCMDRGREVGKGRI